MQLHSPFKLIMYICKRNIKISQFNRTNNYNKTQEIWGFNILV